MIYEYMMFPAGLLWGWLIDSYTRWLVADEYDVALWQKRMWLPVTLLAGVALICNSYLLSTSITEFVVHLLFVSGLFICVRTDCEGLVVFRAVELGMIGAAVAGHLLGVLAISWQMGLASAAAGYAVLWATAFVAARLTGREALGIGDAELIAIIGLMYGPMAMWASVFWGSIIGCVAVAVYSLFCGYRRDLQVPFVPLLAPGLVWFFYW
jgi:leader peptidase (prepilin peptidase)/N-methyltransferase